MSKNISLVVAGTGEVRDLTLTPGTTAREVLEATGLRDYLISAGPDKPFLASEDDVFRAVPEGGKLYTSTPAVAGAV
jgi:hypothetical protein